VVFGFVFNILALQRYGRMCADADAELEPLWSKGWALA